MLPSMADSMVKSPRPLAAVYEYLVMVIGLGMLGSICLVWLPFALILNLLLPQRWAQPVGRFAIMIAFRFYLGFLSVFCAFRFDLSALDALRHDKPLILAANHPSLLDVVMIVSRLPDATCIMKAALMDNLLLGAAARLAHYIRNDSPRKFIRSSRQALAEGAHLLIFPEGTRTTAFPFDPCKRTTGLISSLAGVPVQTLLIEFNRPYLGKCWPLWRRPQLPQHFRIRQGRRFKVPSDCVEFTAELEWYFRQELAAHTIAAMDTSNASLPKLEARHPAQP